MVWLNCAAITHEGRVRTNNEDNYHFAGRYKADPALLRADESASCACSRTVFAVCDGMGGEDQGELAALLAAKQLAGCGAAEVHACARDAVERANNAICARMEQDGVRMGSTLAALYLDGETAIACNVGDSRVYLLRGGGLLQLTQDHTRVQSMVRAGILTAQQAKTHADRHCLTQHLGIFPQEMLLEPYFSAPVDLHPGDRFLLCSDGVTDMLDDAQLARLLGNGGSADAQARQIVNRALEQGGRDNITAIVIAVEQR